MVDQTDPIIAIGGISMSTGAGSTSGYSFCAVDDFFINPSVADVCIDPRILVLVKILQDPPGRAR